MMILDGKIVSQARRQIIQQQCLRFLSVYHRPPCLAVVIVGKDPASHVYVRNKEKSSQAVGILSKKYELDEETQQTELNQLIKKLNEDPGVDGILVQSPLPSHLSEKKILDLIDPNKDVDGFTFKNLGYLFGGNMKVAPCTPQGVLTILDYYKIEVESLHCVVVGRSNIVGKPMAHLLLDRNATVTICHSKTKDLSKLTREADLIVVAAGKKHLLRKENFKPGAIVIDVGIHGSGSGQKISGDVNPENMEGYLKAMTPVPGGVGPMTITTLLENTVKLAFRRMGENL